jgi:hypothetical protein
LNGPYCCGHSTLTASLDYGEELHRSGGILGEWSDMIGYEMGSSPMRLYTTAKTISVKEILSMDEKLTWMST